MLQKSNCQNGIVVPLSVWHLPPPLVPDMAVNKPLTHGSDNDTICERKHAVAHGISGSSNRPSRPFRNLSGCMRPQERNETCCIRCASRNGRASRSAALLATQRTIAGNGHAAASQPGERGRRPGDINTSAGIHLKWQAMARHTTRRDFPST